MAKLLYKLPNGQYIRKELSKPTKYTQNKRTGRMTGRKVVPKGQGDGTRVNRIKQDFVLVKKSKDKRGHIRTVRKNYEDGQIFGRSS